MAAARRVIGEPANAPWSSLKLQTSGLGRRAGRFRARRRRASTRLARISSAMRAGSIAQRSIRHSTGPTPPPLTQNRVKVLPRAFDSRSRYRGRLPTNESCGRRTNHFAAFLAQTDGLADKRDPLLLQLPPSLSFDGTVVSAFLDEVRRVYDGPMVCEPRHATWFSPRVASLLERYRISRVAADPPPVPNATSPAGWARVAYFRLHGSPRTYWSRYDEDAIAALAATIGRLSTAEQVWCVFDNHRKRRRHRECLGAPHVCVTTR
jgi:hypothetical protein